MPPALPPKHTNTTRTLTEGSLRCLPETALHHTNTRTGGPTADSGSPMNHGEYTLADIVIRNITCLNDLVEASKQGEALNISAEAVARVDETLAELRELEESLKYESMAYNAKRFTESMVESRGKMSRRQPRPDSSEEEV